MWKELDSTGTAGCEGGIILKDEEYNNSCSITIEKCSDMYVITCGIYGYMVHTEYAGENYESVYNSMKTALQLFVDDIINTDKEDEFIEDFIFGKYIELAK